MNFVVAAVALYAALLVYASPIAVENTGLEKRSVFGYVSYADPDCNGYQGGSTDTGGSWYYFLPNYSASFLVTESDGTCGVVLYTGTNADGDSVSFAAGSLGVGTCFGASDGEAFRTVLIQCP